MKKVTHKLILCLTAFVFAFSTFGGSVALAAYYNPNKTVGTSAAVKIHKNNFVSTATKIEYTMYVNGKAIGKYPIKMKTSLLSSYAESTISMIAPANLVKETGNTVKVTACYQKEFSDKNIKCHTATMTGVTGKNVDKKTFRLQVDKNGIATLKMS